MSDTARIAVIIPALNEGASIARVLADIPPAMARVIVADNGSTDDTAARARQGGAQVVSEPKRGYGAACLRAMAALQNDPPDIAAFLDADYSDYPEQLPRLIAPITAGVADLVIGSRVAGTAQRGALTPVQLFGNALSVTLIRLLWGVHYSDLGPFRAIRWPALMRLGMADRNYGWTVEMQVKAARAGLRCIEVPVDYRRRIGKSKVSGTLTGSARAGHKILSVIAAEALKGSRLKR
jgi:glycosyltransferase involved in cell wall biosynthesis